MLLAKRFYFSFGGLVSIVGSLIVGSAISATVSMASEIVVNSSG